MVEEPVGHADDVWVAAVVADQERHVGAADSGLETVGRGQGAGGSEGLEGLVLFVTAYAARETLIYITQTK